MDDSEKRQAERERREAEIAAIVKDALNEVVAAWPSDAPALKEYFPSVSAYSEPPHVSIWYFFMTDADLEAAKASGVTAWADRETRARLRTRGLSAEIADDAGVIFVTDEDARRAPNAYHFFNDGSNWYSEPRPAKAP